MKTLKIDEDKAKELYKTASDEFKQILEDAFGKEVLSFSICDKVKSYEDACAATGTTPHDRLELLKIGLTTKEILLRELETIAGALNEGTALGIYDSSIRRWYPVFACNESPASFAFYFSFCVSSNAFAGSGSRLRVLSEEASDHIGETFVDVWEKVQLR